MPHGRPKILLAIILASLLAACAAPTPVSGQTPPSSSQPTMTMPPNPMIGGVAMYPSRDIAENLAQSPDHHTLVAALNLAGLSGALKQPGPLTIFAPTDSAFRALPPGLLDQLMLPANQARLAALLNNHVVAGRLDSSALGQQVASGNGITELTTAAGTKLVARLNGAVNLLLRDGAGNFVDISIYDVVNATESFTSSTGSCSRRRRHSQGGRHDPPHRAPASFARAAPTAAALLVGLAVACVSTAAQADHRAISSAGMAAASPARSTPAFIISTASYSSAPATRSIRATTRTTRPPIRRRSISRRPIATTPCRAHRASPISIPALVSMSDRSRCPEIGRATREVNASSEPL